MSFQLLKNLGYKKIFQQQAVGDNILYEYQLNIEIGWSWVEMRFCWNWNKNLLNWNKIYEKIVDEYFLIHWSII